MIIMKFHQKRGISPVIATVLLIVIAIALFIVIFFWIKNMQQESVMKFGSDIKQSCLKINFEAIYQSENSILQLQNTGSVSIWKAEIFKKQAGSLVKISGIQGPISQGESSNIQIDGCEQVKIVPILLGISKKSGAEKEYKCEEKAKIISC